MLNLIFALFLTCPDIGINPLSEEDSLYYLNAYIGFRNICARKFTADTAIVLDSVTFNEDDDTLRIYERGGNIYKCYIPDSSDHADTSDYAYNVPCDSIKDCKVDSSGYADTSGYAYNVPCDSIKDCKVDSAWHSDSLDGAHGSQYLRSDVQDTASERITFLKQVRADSGMEIGGSLFLFGDDVMGNIKLGFSAGSVATGEGNTFIGCEVGKFYDNNSLYNTGLGHLAMAFSKTGSNNVAIGRGALKNSLWGNGNVGIGDEALLSDTMGNSNVVVGDYAGGMGQGSNNVYLGKNAGLLNCGNGNLFLGYLTGSQRTADTNKLFVDNTNTNTPLIWADFDRDSVIINGSLRVEKGVVTDSVTAISDTLTIRGDSLITLEGFNLNLLDVPSNSPEGMWTLVGGQNCHTADSFTFAFGKCCSATVWGGIAMGGYSSSSDTEAVAIGCSNKAKGKHSWAIMHSNYSNGDEAFTVGYGNTGDGQQCFVGGNQSHGTGIRGIAFGSKCSTRAAEAFSGGREVFNQSRYAFAWGYDLKIRGDSATHSCNILFGRGGLIDSTNNSVLFADGDDTLDTPNTFKVGQDSAIMPPTRFTGDVKIDGNISHTTQKRWYESLVETMINWGFGTNTDTTLIIPAGADTAIISIGYPYDYILDSLQITGANFNTTTLFKADTGALKTTYRVEIITAESDTARLFYLCKIDSAGAITRPDTCTTVIAHSDTLKFSQFGYFVSPQ